MLEGNLDLTKTHEQLYDDLKNLDLIPKLDFLDVNG
jgi:hypothetical protein